MDSNTITSNRSDNRIHIAMAFVLGVIFIGFFLSYLHGRFWTENVKLYTRVDAWIISSECTAKTGKFLMVCGHGDVEEGIEDFSHGDDRGQALYGNFFAYFTGKAITLVDFFNFNTFIHFLSFLIPIILFYLRRKYLYALGYLFICHGLLINYRYTYSPDVTDIYPALGILGLINAIWLVWSFSDQSKVPWLRCAISLFAVFMLALLRDSHQLTIAVSLMVYGGTLLLVKSYRLLGMKTFLAGLAFVLIASNASTLLLGVRNMILGTHFGSGIPGHGISHSIVAGLGTTDNPWGRDHTDQYVYKEVTKINPNASYLSAEHFKIAWKIYFHFLKEKPLEVLDFYIFNKFGKYTFRFLERFVPWGLEYVFFFIPIILIMIYFRFRILLHELNFSVVCALLFLMMPVLSKPESEIFIRSPVYNLSIASILCIVSLLSYLIRNAPTFKSNLFNFLKKIQTNTTGFEHSFQSTNVIIKDDKPSFTFMKFQGLLTGFIVCMMLICILTKKELFPFAPYSMYSYSMNASRLRIFNIYYVMEDGSEVVLEQKYVEPMDEARIKFSIETEYWKNRGSLKSEGVDNRLQGLLNLGKEKLPQAKALEVRILGYENYEALKLNRANILDRHRWPQ